MTTTASSSTPEWGIESARLTLFPTVTLQGMDVVQRIWRQLAEGVEPEESTSKTSAAAHIVHGPVGAGRLITATQPGRIDIQFTVEVDVAPVTYLLGPSGDVLPNFRDRLQPLVKDCPAVHRIAFGVVFLQPTDTRETGYRALERYLPALKLDAEGSSDLLYQINRPRPSQSVEGLSINRLMKWSVQSMNLVQMQQQVLGSAIVAAPTFVTGASGFSARLEVDLSTAVTGREILAASLPALVDEHVQIAAEIAARGDVP